MIDIKQTSDGDIDLSTGDILMIESTEQHKRDILIASLGDLAESPLTGVGLMDYINGTNDEMMLRNISQQMQKDGIKIKSIGFDQHGQLEIDGGYENNKN